MKKDSFEEFLEEEREAKLKLLKCTPPALIKAIGKKYASIDDIPLKELLAHSKLNEVPRKTFEMVELKDLLGALVIKLSEMGLIDSKNDSKNKDNNSFTM